MNIPKVPVTNIPQLILKARELTTTLRDFRTLLGQPETTATVCETLANTIRHYPLPSTGKQARKAPPKAPPAPTQPRKVPPKIADLKTVQSRVAAGRQAVLNGDRPKLVDAITTVMGQDTVSSPDILARLEKRGWAPQATKPVSYISFTLSANPKRFTRASRGHYCVNAVNEEALKELLGLSRLSNRDLIQKLPEALRSKVHAKDSRSRVNQVILRLLRDHPREAPKFHQSLTSAHA